MKLKPKMVKKIKSYNYYSREIHIVELTDRYFNLFKSFSDFYLIPRFDEEWYIKGIVDIKGKRKLNYYRLSRLYVDKKTELMNMKKIKFTNIKDKAKFKLYQ